MHSCSVGEGDAGQLSGAETWLSEVPIQCMAVAHMFGLKFITEFT